MSRAIAKLAKLSRREWVELVQAQLALISAQVLVWTRPTGRLVSSAVAGADAPGEVPGGEDSARALDARAPRLARAVGRAAENGLFRPLCLVRAVALNRLLEQHGIHGSRIRIGVRMRGGRFAAHAWVEYGHRVLGDNEAHVGSFAELAEVHLVDAP